jgi:hypothetical protein
MWGQGDRRSIRFLCCRAWQRAGRGSATSGRLSLGTPLGSATTRRDAALGEAIARRKIRPPPVTALDVVGGALLADLAPKPRNSGFSGNYPGSRQEPRLGGGGEELSLNPFFPEINGLRTTQIAVDVVGRILAPLWRSPSAPVGAGSSRSVRSHFVDLLSDANMLPALELVPSRSSEASPTFWCTGSRLPDRWVIIVFDAGPGGQAIALQLAAAAGAL